MPEPSFSTWAVVFTFAGGLIGELSKSLLGNYLSIHVNPMIEKGRSRVGRWRRWRSWFDRSERRRSREAGAAWLVGDHAEQQYRLAQALSVRLRGMTCYGAAGATFFFAGFWTFSGPQPWMAVAPVYALNIFVGLFALLGLAMNFLASELEQMVGDARALERKAKSLELHAKITALETAIDSVHEEGVQSAATPQSGSRRRQRKPRK